MKCYRVGGAVRDRLLGLPVQDNDWVVVGACPEQLLAKNYRPVGRDFPVFLHPDTGEEYALARTERKVGRGYRGFHFHASPSVCLEDDLRRRDLTINAMAEGPEGELIDPFGGQEDLKQGLLRHVSPAFVEDPLRVLRVARFAARLNFQVVEETLEYMAQISASGELDALAPERVWQEWERALTERSPARFFQVLESCGALEQLYPPLLAGAAALRFLDRAAARTESTVVRFAAHTAILQQAEKIRALADRYRIPLAFRDAALLTVHCRVLVHGEQWSAPLVSSLLRTVDALRRPQRLAQLCEVLRACATAGDDTEGFACSMEEVERRIDCLPRVLEAAQQVSVQQFQKAGLSGAALGQALNEQREQAIRESLAACLSTWGAAPRS